MNTHNGRTMVVMGFAVLAGLISMAISAQAILEGSDKRVADVTEVQSAELERIRSDRDNQRRINAEQSLLIDELLVAATPEQRAEAIRDSRERQEAAGITPSPTTTRPTGSSQSPGTTSPGTTTPPNSTTTTTTQPNSTTTTTRLCVAGVCL